VGLDTAPIELGEGWGDSASDARAVIERVRQACLGGVPLVSDRQPERLRIDEHRSGPPHLWLHKDNPGTAWIVLDFAPLHWIQLAYQLGHELGHVLCNSWVFGAQLDQPSRWLEEAMVEALSLRGLGRLAAQWEKAPPFPHNEGYAAQIRQYRDDAVARYGGADGQTTAAWLEAARSVLDQAHGLGPEDGPGIHAILAEFDRDPACISDMGAVNRWPERSALPVEQYLQRWQASCAERGAPGRLPRRLREVFGLT